MATIINNPGAGTTESSGGAGTIIAIVIALVVVAALLFVGIPWLRGQSGAGANRASVNVPSSIDVNVPEKVNIDVNKQP